MIDPNLSSYDKLLFLNHELFYMIETSVDIHLLAYLYSSQLITKDKKSFVRQETDLFQMAYRNYGRGACQTENSKVPAPPLNSWISMLCTSVLFYMTGPLFKGKFSLTERSDKLLASCTGHICGWNLIAMYSKEAASFPYIKITGVNSRDFSQSTPVLLQSRFSIRLVMTFYTRHS